jgi:hypothetical protein
LRELPFAQQAIHGHPINSRSPRARVKRCIVAAGRATPLIALDPIPLAPGRFQLVQRPSREAQIDGAANQRSLTQLALADLDFKN